MNEDDPRRVDENKSGPPAYGQPFAASLRTARDSAIRCWHAMQACRAYGASVAARVNTQGPDAERTETALIAELQASLAPAIDRLRPIERELARVSLPVEVEQMKYASFTGALLSEAQRCVDLSRGVLTAKWRMISFGEGGGNGEPLVHECDAWLASRAGFNHSTQLGRPHWPAQDVLLGIQREFSAVAEAYGLALDPVTGTPSHTDRKPWQPSALEVEVVDQELAVFRANGAEVRRLRDGDMRPQSWTRLLDFAANDGRLRAPRPQRRATGAKDSAADGSGSTDGPTQNRQSRETWTRSVRFLNQQLTKLVPLSSEAFRADRGGRYLSQFRALRCIWSPGNGPQPKD